MKSAQIRELATEEIREELRQRTEELFNLRFRKETEQLENPAQMTTIKRTIARLQTILREREMTSGESKTE